MYMAMYMVMYINIGPYYLTTYKRCIKLPGNDMKGK